ncbi:hypothetical protein IH981_03745 [Patescibacteria group bacterium]|nr:hypothetical protein [Patescibacteria group bacterium]
MKAYRIKITGDKYPTEYTVEASGWSTAIARAIKEWKKRFKGSRTEELKIHAIKGGAILREEN